MTEGALTVAALKLCSMRVVLHASMAHGGAMYAYQCVEHPRLTKSTRRETGRAPWVSSMAVDDLDCETLQAVVEALNRTPEENNKMAEEQNQQPAAPKKWELSDGIAEVQRWKEHSAKTNQTLIARGQLTEHEARLHEQAQDGLLKLLGYLQQNADAFRAFMKKRSAAA
jgi:hypothetical protein